MPENTSTEKKPVCPKCSEEIKTLPYLSKRTVIGELTADGHMEDDPFTEEETGVEFFCPECMEDLFFDADAAAEFLNSESAE